MGQKLKDRSEVCPLPPGPLKDLNLYLRPNPILVAASLTFILMTSGLVYYWMLLPPIIPFEPPPLTPHAAIAIDGDANFTATALLEGWPGDGSPENPFIIDGLAIELDGNNGSCISISNTRNSFTISNCNLTGALLLGQIGIGDAGIFLENVINGKLVNNICNGNDLGIRLINSHSNTIANNTCKGNTGGINLENSDSNTVASNTCKDNAGGIGFRRSVSNIVINNTCTNNFGGITILSFSDSNTVMDNTCNNNTEWGIGLWGSDSNTVTNNTCNNNTIGIRLDEFPIGAGGGSYSNTVVDNTCNNNGIGIYLYKSDYNTVANNTCNNNGLEYALGSGIYLEISDSNTLVNNICNNNRIGIYLNESYSNTVANNTLLGNTEHDIVHDIELEELAHQDYVAEQFVWFLAGCGMILVVAVIAFVKYRRMEI